MMMTYRLELMCGFWTGHTIVLAHSLHVLSVCDLYKIGFVNIPLYVASPLPIGLWAVSGCWEERDIFFSGFTTDKVAGAPVNMPY